MEFAYSSESRIRKRHDFLRIREAGRKISSTHFLLSYVHSESVSRLGLVVSKKAEASSVRRNRCKRMIREVFRLNRGLLREPVELVVVVRKTVADLAYKDLKRELLGLFGRAKLIVRHQ